jgi:hypothetical protein
VSSVARNGCIVKDRAVRKATEKAKVLEAIVICLFVKLKKGCVEVGTLGKGAQGSGLKLETQVKVLWTQAWDSTQKSKVFKATMRATLNSCTGCYVSK